MGGETDKCLTVRQDGGGRKAVHSFKDAEEGVGKGGVAADFGVEGGKVGFVGAGKEFAEGLRALLPEGSIREAEHNRKRSFCCGSLLRAAGKPEKGAEQSRKHGEEAVAAQADAIVTACMSCTFLLSKEQHDVPVFHYLELLYDWRIDWENTPPYMTLRFLFDEPEQSGESRRTFVSLDADGAAE